MFKVFLLQSLAWLYDALLSLLLQASLKYHCLNISFTVKARLQPFTVVFSFSAILVCFIDAQIHSFFLENMSGFERQ